MSLLRPGTRSLQTSRISTQFKFKPGRFTGMIHLKRPNMMRLLRAITTIAICLPLVSNATSKNGFRLDDTLVPSREILNGGPPRDGIPSLDNPQFVAADDATFLKPRDRVLGLAYNGVFRAYPVRILNYHEIVNDVLHGKPIVVSYCPLCGSGMAFASDFMDKRFQFGVSGLLYNSDVLMYDRQTKSLWSQLKRLAISGPMKSTRLESLPVSHTTWRDWKQRHPQTQVLTTETGFRRNYRANPYPNYGRSGRLYFPVARESKLYKRKTVVMGLEIDGKFKAYTFPELHKGPERFSDAFQGRQFSVYYDKDNDTARVIEEDGNEIPTTMAFWFAWYAFHPDTEIYTSK